MKLWLTAQEIADLALPGIPAGKRGVNVMAERERWGSRITLNRPRRGVGGGTEYHLDLLPPAAREAYVAQHIGDPVPLNLAEAAEAEPAAAHLRDDAAEARDARLAILAAADRYQGRANLPRHHADLLFVQGVRSGRVEFPGWVTARVGKLSLRTLQRWRAEAKAGRTATLAVDRGASRRGSGVMDSAEEGGLRIYVLALIARQPHLSADHVRAMLLARYGDTVTVQRAGGVLERVPIPPIRTVQDALKRWRETERVTLTAMTNPDGFKSRYRMSGKSTDRAIRAPNALWQIDASPMDALCVDGRHSVYVAIDVYTRRVVVYVSRTPRAEAVGLLMRRAIMAWGVPERVKTDNGSDFTARATERLLAHLGIERDLSPAFTPEAKAFVERAIGTFQRDFAPLLPGFVGHSVADRKVIEARRAFAARIGDSDDAKAFCVELQGAELQAYCDRWAVDRYQHRPHSGLDGATPFAVAAAYSGALRQLDDVRALDVLLAAVPGRDGRRTIGKQGIRIDGSHYLPPAGLLPDREVLVRMDPADLGRIWLFDLDGARYLGEAVCPDLAGIDPRRAVAEAKQAQRDHIVEETARIRREARRIRPRDFVDTILRRDAEAAGKLLAFPTVAASHTTPALDAAAHVGRPDTADVVAFVPPTLNAADAAMMAEIEADMASPAGAPNVTALRSFDTPQHRFRRALDLGSRLEAGETVSTDDLLWLGGYRAGPEFRSLSAVYEDFGEAALR